MYLLQPTKNSERPKNKDYLSSATGFIVSLLSLIVFGKDNFIIPAMIAIVVVLLSLRRKYDAN